MNVAENNLKSIKGKKIRRQYFNFPLIILYSAALVIPYAIFTISLCMGKFDSSQWPSTLWTSVWVCFVFSLPFLVLRELNKHLFGRILCVLTEEGIHYPKGKLLWGTIEKVEYAIDTKPRYKTDRPRSFRTIIYTKGGKHIALTDTPLHIVSQMKKRCSGLDIKISGASSLLPATLIMAVIFAVLPFYTVLLRNAPGAFGSHIIVMLVVGIISGILRTYVFDTYAIPYRFWRRILPKKWLSYIILGVYYSSFFIVILILFYFSNWVVASLLGIYLGVVRPPMPSRYGSSRHRRILSYEQLCELYIAKADYWEKKIEKCKENRTK